MSSLDEQVQDALSTIPRLAFCHVIGKKLRTKGAPLPDDTLGEIFDKLLTTKDEVFNWEDGTDQEIEISETDLQEVIDFIKDFLDNKLASVFAKASSDVGKIVFGDLQQEWVNEFALQRQEIGDFCERLESRWGNALKLLRMMLTIAREVSNTAWIRKLQTDDSGRVEETICRLHVRACQVAAEVVSLLENGFADGALARWRTLHEIIVVAEIIRKFGGDIADRYLNHQIIRRRQSVEDQLKSGFPLSSLRMSEKQHQALEEEYQAALNKYGRAFRFDYGWTSHHLKINKPTFADLEKNTGLTNMRRHYRWASQYVHAGSPSLFFKPSQMGYSEELLAGPSNAGLLEPGVNTLHSLIQITLLLFREPFSFEMLVTMRVMSLLRKEAVPLFRKADRILRSEHKSNKRRRIRVSKLAT